MKTFPIVVVAAATQYPDKLQEAVEKALGEAGYAANTHEYQCKLDHVVYHSDKEKREEVEPDVFKTSYTKVFAHYVTVTVSRIPQNAAAAVE